MTTSQFALSFLHFHLISFAYYLLTWIGTGTSTGADDATGEAHNSDHDDDDDNCAIPKQEHLDLNSQEAT